MLATGIDVVICNASTAAAQRSIYNFSTHWATLLPSTVTAATTLVAGLLLTVASALPTLAGLLSALPTTTLPRLLPTWLAALLSLLPALLTRLAALHRLRPLLSGPAVLSWLLPIRSRLAGTPVLTWPARLPCT